MSDPIVSRQTIALQARQAVLHHITSGNALPPNPYCEHFDPAHHLEYAASIARELHAATAPEAERSA